MAMKTIEVYCCLPISGLLITLAGNKDSSMPVRFIKQNIGEEIRDDNVARITGYSEDELIGFTGAKVDEILYTEFKGKYPNLKISIITMQYYLQRRIDFSDGTIYNESFFMKNLNDRRKSIGSTIFFVQVNNTLEAGFEKILVEASGNPATIYTQNGYYTWARLGYSIIDEDVEKFNRLMKQFGMHIATMQQLMLTYKGRDIWRSYGFSFEGIFTLNKTSVNYRALAQYMKEKKLI